MVDSPEQSHEKRHLVVTSDQNLWSVDQKLLFLGQWCALYEQREAWANRDIIIAKPFLANMDEYIFEAEKLRDLENKIVTCLTPLLNQLHAKSFSKREWKIILGHWLHRYVTVFFNRYNTLYRCMKNYEVSSVSFYPPNSYSLATRTSNEFNMACNNPLWNSVLWREIWIKAGFEKHKISFVKKPEKSSFSFVEESKDTFFYRCMFKLSSILNRNSQFMIINPYLPKKTQVLLALKHFLFPQIWPKNRKSLDSKSDPEMREQLRKECAKSFTSEFETICIDLMFDVIPICYVEGFQEVQRNAKKLGFPKKPAVIFTSNNFDTDEEFKSWVAGHVQQGAKYVIGQHGANYGINTIESPYNEEVVADTFITWGIHQRYLNSQPGFIFTYPYPNMMPYDKDGGILIVQLAPPFHIYHYDAFHIYQSYVDDLGAFYQKLPSSLQSKITVRLPGLSAKSGSADIERWQTIDPKIKIDNFSCPFAQVVSESRLIVFTYFSTGVLECISQDIPVICFWKHPLETVNHDVRHLFKELMDAKILHGTHSHAAEHLLAINGNIEEWWHSEETCKGREQFTKYFAQHSKTPVNDLSNILSSGVDL